MRGHLPLPLLSPSSTLGLTWSLSSSSPLRVVAIGIVSGGVNDVVSGCLPVVALTTTAAAAAAAAVVTRAAIVVAGGDGGRRGWRLASSAVA